MVLVICKYAQMHQNTFLTTPDGKNIFFEKSFWWSGSMRKFIKTRFLPLHMLKNIFLRT
jgi:hypothetical protein